MNDARRQLERLLDRPDINPQTAELIERALRGDQKQKVQSPTGAHADATGVNTRPHEGISDDEHTWTE